MIEIQKWEGILERKGMYWQFCVSHISGYVPWRL